MWHWAKIWRFASLMNCSDVISLFRRPRNEHGRSVASATFVAKKRWTQMSPQYFLTQEKLFVITNAQTKLFAIQNIVCDTIFFALTNIYVIWNECTIYLCDHDNTSLITDYCKIFYVITNQCTISFLVMNKTGVFEPRHKYVHICNTFVHILCICKYNWKYKYKIQRCARASAQICAWHLWSSPCLCCPSTSPGSGGLILMITMIMMIMIR